MSWCFERTGDQVIRMSWSFEWTGDQVIWTDANFFERFTNGCKWNPAQKRKVVRVRFPVHGHKCMGNLNFPYNVMKNNKIGHLPPVSHVVVIRCVYGGFWNGLDVNWGAGRKLKITGKRRINPRMSRGGLKWTSLRFLRPKSWSFQAIKMKLSVPVVW